MLESTAREVTISDVSRATFLSLLEYMYTDRLVLADGDVQELFVAADRVRPHYKLPTHPVRFTDVILFR